MRLRVGKSVRILLLSSLLANTFAAYNSVPALAGECDGTAAPDNIICNASPTSPDAFVGLGTGADVYLQLTGVQSTRVRGDSNADGTTYIGNGDNDDITIIGTVLLGVEGDGVNGIAANDTITINGSAGSVAGDAVAGDGGDDLISVNGTVSGDVNGDQATGNGGDDIITIGVAGSAGNIYGDAAALSGGSDTIRILGSVGGTVNGDGGAGAAGNDSITINSTGSVGGTLDGGGGNDTVVIESAAHVGGTIDGGAGTDSLRMDFMYQDQLDALSPAGGSLSYGGETYTWANFEQLLTVLTRVLATINEETGGGPRIVFQGSGGLAVASEDGITVFAVHDRVAFIPYFAIKDLKPGDPWMNFQAANADGWHVSVANLGTNPDNLQTDLFQVFVYDATGLLVAQFTFAYKA